MLSGGHPDRPDSITAAERRFANLLEELLRKGMRPQNSLKKGSWKKVEFAKAVGSKTGQAASQWCSASSFPMGKIEVFLAKLFGPEQSTDDPERIKARSDLMEAYKAVLSERSAANPEFDETYSHINLTSKVQTLPAEQDGSSAADRELTERAHGIFELAEAAAENEELNKSHELFSSALEFFRRAGDAGGEADCLLNIGRLAARQHQFIQARSHFDGAREIYRQNEIGIGEIWCLDYLSRIEQHLGRRDKAWRNLEELRTICISNRFPREEAECVVDMARIAEKREEFTHALELLGEAEKLYRQAGMRGYEAECLFDEGRIISKSGENERSFQFFDAARERFHDLGGKHWEALCELELAEIARKQHKRKLSRALYEGAAEGFRDCEDQKRLALCTIMLKILSDDYQNEIKDSKNNYYIEFMCRDE